MVNAWNAFAVRPLVPTSITNGNTAAGYSTANMLNDYLGVVWKSAGGAANEVLVVDLGSAQVIDTALFFGCTGAVNLFWLLTVEAASDAGFTTGLYSAGAAATFLAGNTQPSHGRGVGYWTAPDVPPARRYWRFSLSGLASAAVTIGRIVLGSRLTLERNFAFGGAFGVRDFGSVDFSAYGVLLRRRAAKLRTLGVTFSWVRKDEIVAKVQPLIELCAGQEPIAIVTDPTADADRQLRCWFGPMVGDMGTIWRTAAAWEWRVSMIDLVAIPKAA